MKGWRRRRVEAYLNELEGRCRALGPIRDDTPWLPSEDDPRNLAVVDARIELPGEPNAVLRIVESIDMRIGPDPRVEYIYHYVEAGVPIFGWHRQPGEEWIDHCHDYATATISPLTIDFREVVSIVLSRRTT